MWKWKYLVVDDFLDQEDLDLITKFWEKKAKKLGPEQRLFKVHKITLMPESNLYHSLNALTEEEVLRIQRKYEPRLMKFLEELAPQRIKEAKYLELTVAGNGASYMHSPHVDKIEKLLSVVVYISPEENTGTILYEAPDGKSLKEPSEKALKNGEGHKYGKALRRRVVPWKRNRALIFARGADTWHSWKGNGKEPRLTLLLNIKCFDKQKLPEGADFGNEEDYEAMDKTDSMK